MPCGSLGMKTWWKKLLGFVLVIYWRSLSDMNICQISKINFTSGFIILCSQTFCMGSRIMYPALQSTLTKVRCYTNLVWNHEAKHTNGVWLQNWMWCCVIIPMLTVCVNTHNCGNIARRGQSVLIWTSTCGLPCGKSCSVWVCASRWLSC